MQLSKAFQILASAALGAPARVHSAVNNDAALASRDHVVSKVELVALGVVGRLGSSREAKCDECGFSECLCVTFGLTRPGNPNGNWEDNDDNDDFRDRDPPNNNDEDQMQNRTFIAQPKPHTVSKSLTSLVASVFDG
ncbi:hypothetical protein PspLS_00178 [Pyricularia sp. CBS 133598]|nr:hypothetical protein PspLS_00178 [Pyricularia sp. CBS 133598]